MSEHRLDAERLDPRGIRRTVAAPAVELLAHPLWTRVAVGAGATCFVLHGLVTFFPNFLVLLIVWAPLQVAGAIVHLIDPDWPALAWRALRVGRGRLRWRVWS